MTDSWLKLAWAVTGNRQANTPAAASDFRDIGLTVATALEFAPHVDAAVAARPSHGEAGPRRGGGALAQAHGAGRPRAPGRHRPVVVAARRMARASELHADRARGD